MKKNILVYFLSFGMIVLLLSSAHAFEQRYPHSYLYYKGEGVLADLGLIIELDNESVLRIANGEKRDLAKEYFDSACQVLIKDLVSKENEMSNWFFFTKSHYLLELYDFNPIVMIRLYFDPDDNRIRYRIMPIKNGELLFGIDKYDYHYRHDSKRPFNHLPSDKIRSALEDAGLL